jgi:hypothetical protein
MHFEVSMLRIGTPKPISQLEQATAILRQFAQYVKRVDPESKHALEPDELIPPNRFKPVKRSRDLFPPEQVNCPHFLNSVGSPVGLSNMKEFRPGREHQGKKIIEISDTTLRPDPDEKSIFP